MFSHVKIKRNTKMKFLLECIHSSLSRANLNVSKSHQTETKIERERDDITLMAMYREVQNHQNCENLRCFS